MCVEDEYRGDADHLDAQQRQSQLDVGIFLPIVRQKLVCIVKLSMWERQHLYIGGHPASKQAIEAQLRIEATYIQSRS